MPKRLPIVEFVALTAMLFATIAFSIDAMLPALPEIGAELSPMDINQAQLIVTAFVLGMGAGTFIAGPLSDAYGRKSILLTGSVLYMLGAYLAWESESLSGLLAARALQGFGAAGPRVVAMAIIRDLYSGRQMAKLMSFTMLVFSLVPAIAPALGAIIIHYWSWRAIFLAFILFATITTAWVALRQAETLPKDARIPMRLESFSFALREAAGNRMFVLSVLVQTLIFGLLMSVISTTQQIYDVVYGRADEFPFWFAMSSVISATASIVNAFFVVRIGMRALISVALAVELVISILVILSTLAGWIPEALEFPVWFFWSTSMFFMLGLTLGNLNALAMEPMGHIAGMAASIIGAFSTVFSLVIAVPIGLSFNGTILPLAVGAVVTTGLASLLMRFIARLERVSVNL